MDGASVTPSSASVGAVLSAKAAGKSAIVTMYAGECTQLRRITLSTFECYAREHGFEVVLAEPVVGVSPAWGKVQALQAALDHYAIAVWIDADAILLDGAANIADWLPGPAFQAFAQDRRLEFGLNSWLWAIRAGGPSKRFLNAVWSHRSDYPDQPWELGAIQHVLAAQPDFQIGTVLFGSEWNQPQGSALHAGYQVGNYEERAKYLTGKGFRQEAV